MTNETKALGIPSQPREKQQGQTVGCPCPTVEKEEQGACQKAQVFLNKKE